ncbi:MAG TPA: glycosyltransferase family 2 protein, partial [Chitinophagaceae bacterium]|nr:glycosyltransferase family 2 protein [Chitinophagaceae bacterium]
MSNFNNIISICIPAYKRPENIARLLQSISIQTCKNYEIIITDDSPDDSLIKVLQKYSHLPIQYYKNETALGTPANWNYGISKASGEWIKLMHDDDWFSSEKSLQHFADHTADKKKFIFS